MMIYDKLYLKLIELVSSETGIPKDVVLVAYRSLWEFIRNNIQNLGLKDIKTQEEFDALRTSFNIPSIGKLYTSWDKILKIRRRVNYLKSINNEEIKTN